MSESQIAMRDLISRNRDDYTVWTPVNIRYSDQDPMQHVNNVAITAFLESGRTGLLHAMFTDIALPTRGMVLANLNIDYLHEIKFPGIVDVGGRLSAVGTKSLTAQFAVFQGDTCCVTSQSTNVFFDPEIRKAAAPASDIKAMLDAFLVAQG